jgi:hypothetical protein
MIQVWALALRGFLSTLDDVVDRGFLQYYFVVHAISVQVYDPSSYAKYRRRPRLSVLLYLFTTD